MDERKAKVPNDQVENDAQLKLQASDFLFGLYNEMGLAEVDNRIALPLLDITLSYGPKVASKITEGISLSNSKYFWLRVFKVLSSVKGADEGALVHFIPLEVNKMMAVGE